MRLSTLLALACVLTILSTGTSAPPPRRPPLREPGGDLGQKLIPPVDQQQPIPELRPKKDKADAALEAKAKKELRQAVLLEMRGFEEEARKRYQDILKKYPRTKTALKAKALLDDEE